MDSGIIGVMDSKVDELESFELTEDNGGRELSARLDIDQRLTDLSGEVIGYHGYAAKEDVFERDITEVTNEGIQQRTKNQVDWRSTEYVLSPDGFLIVGNSDGVFLFNMLEEYFDIKISRAKIDLKEFCEANGIGNKQDDAEIWKAGFYNRGPTADNGVVHGENILDDNDFAKVVADNPLNQLGIEYSRDGTYYKVFLTESGYLDIYAPKDIVTSDLVAYVSDEITDFIHN